MNATLARCTLLTICLLSLVSCDLFRDKSIPPGVDKAEVSHVPAKPDFNRDIRPLLWKLSNQENASYAAAWEKWAYQGLPFPTIADFKLGTQTSYGISTAQEFTLLWRWSQQGGSTDHQPWLLTELPKYKKSWRVAGELTKEQKLSLSQYWIDHLGEIPLQKTALRKYLSEKLVGNLNYQSFLVDLHTLPVGHSHDIEQLKTAYWVETPSTLSKRFLNILGAQEEKILGFPLQTKDLFSDFGTGQPRRLYDSATLAQINDLQSEIALKSKELSAKLIEPNQLPSFDLDSAAYLPQRSPVIKLDFEKESSKGYWGNGLSLSSSGEKIELVNVDLISALAYWTKGESKLGLEYEKNKLTIHSKPHEVSIKVHMANQLVDSYLYPIHIPSEWQHLVLSHDLSSTNGFALHLNGKNITPKRHFPLDIYHTPNILTLKGAGIIDGLKVYDGFPLSHLECQTIYDPRLAVLFKQDSPIVTAHLNHFHNPLVSDQFRDLQLLWDKYSNLYSNTTVQNVLLPERHYDIPQGIYFTDLVSIEASSSLASLPISLTTEMKQVLARTTVNWLYHFINGEYAFDVNFPEDRLPDLSSTVDRWAASLIYHNWDLEPVISELYEHKKSANN